MEKGTGIATLTLNLLVTWKINNNCSIYTADMLVIHSVIKYTKKKKHQKHKK